MKTNNETCFVKDGTIVISASNEVIGVGKIIENNADFAIVKISATETEKEKFMVIMQEHIVYTSPWKIRFKKQIDKTYRFMAHDSCGFIIDLCVTAGKAHMENPRD